MADTLLASPATPFAVPSSRWDDAVAATLLPAELLLYRSNLLGSDLTVTNFGGGNTSAKLSEVDPLDGELVEVLWVKGSGGDIGSMKLDGFSPLYQSKLLGLEAHYAGPEDDDQMVGYLPHCTFNLNGRTASIDTPLHSLLPFAHVDHVHPDAIIALAASSGGKAATQEIWGARIGWLQWKRPGYALGVQLRDFVKANPQVEGVMLADHTPSMTRRSSQRLVSKPEARSMSCRAIARAAGVSARRRNARQWASARGLFDHPSRLSQSYFERIVWPLLSTGMQARMYLGVRSVSQASEAR